MPASRAKNPRTSPRLITMMRSLMPISSSISDEMRRTAAYLYPLVNSIIIFVAAWVDGRRTQLIEKLEPRKIRID